MTYRRFQPFMQPGGHEHRTLANINKGELTQPFDASRIKSTTIPVARYVEKELKRWRNIHRNHASYVEMSSELVADDAYVIQAFLTTLGSQTLAALDRGLVWGRDDKCIDFEQTAEFYNRDLRRGLIAEAKANQLMALARTEPELREARARFVYLRMQGSLSNGVYTNRPPVLAV